MGTETLNINISSEIRSQNDKFESTFAKGDAAGMATLYTEDGMLLPTGCDVIVGHKGIQDFWQGAMNMGVKEVKLHTVEVEQYNGTAIELGNYRLNGEDGEKLDHGKYIVIWKKQNGSWKLQKDIWNSNLNHH